MIGTPLTRRLKMSNRFAARLTIHILTAVAEHEREMISARITAALAAARTNEALQVASTGTAFPLGA
jgi:DNA invertase Pin-like site-specific DNA recombinase